MSKIQLDIIDTMGNITKLPLPNDKTMTELIPSIITLADLAKKDSHGRAFEYRLYSRRQLTVLNQNGTLYSNGVMADDQLRIAPAPFNTYLEFELLTSPEPGTIINLPPRAQLSLGRGSKNHIIIRDPIVSREHGELIWQDGIHIYRDLNSANGSYINNLPVTEPTPLTINSVLSLGETIRLRYQETAVENIKPETGQLGASHTSSAGDIRTSLSPLPRAGIFISHAVTDQDTLTPIIDKLRNMNFHIFWTAEIPPGSNVEEAVETHLTYSDVMIVFLTQSASVTSALNTQWNRFILNRKPIVVVRYEDVELPSSIDGATVVPFRGSQMRLMQELVAAIIQAIR